MDHSDGLICFKDRDSKIIASSKAYALLRGEKNNSNIVGKTDFDHFTHEVAMKILKDETNIINTGKTKVGIMERVVKPDGNIIWLSVEKNPLYDREKNIIGTWELFRDITSLKDAEQEFINLNKKLADVNAKLKKLSSKDALSGLFNQGHFFEELKERFELNKRRSQKDIIKGFSLIIFDIDDFKGINDVYGHLMGDSAIKHIGDLIKKSVRISDTSFRYGGDEFAIILTDTNLIETKEVAEKLREKVESSSIKIMDKEIKLTVSVGVSNFNEASDEKHMIKLSDERLYNSKKRGKNRVY